MAFGLRLVRHFFLSFFLSRQLGLLLAQQGSVQGLIIIHQLTKRTRGDGIQPAVLAGPALHATNLSAGRGPL